MTSSPRVEAKHDRSRTFSSLRVKMGAHAADVLKRLPQPFESAELRCPECGRESRVAPPFDLRRFSCRLCAAYVHPFVWVEGAPVDLVAMRAMLAAIHYDVKVAEHVLLALKLEPNRGTALEPLLHVPSLAAHALVACIRSAPSQLPWWAVFAVLHPGALAGLCFAAHSRARERHERETEELMTGRLSMASFDPRLQLDFAHSPRAASVLEQLDVHGDWPKALYGGLEAYSALGAQEHSNWSIVVDRRERLDKRLSGAVELDASALVSEVVREVVQSQPDADTQVSDRELLLLRTGDLPVENRYRDDLIDSDLLGEARRSPRARHAYVQNRVIETFNFADGDVTWSCLRPQARGPLSGVRWVTYHRHGWGRGVVIDGRHVDPDLELERKAERIAIIKGEGGVLEKLWISVPRWLRSFALSTLFFGATWFAASLWFANNANDAMLLQVGGRAGFVLLLASLAWRRYRQRKNPFPMAFWPEGELDHVVAVQRRTQAIRIKIRRAWGLLVRASPAPVSKTLSAIRPLDRLDRETAAFAVYCQDRLIQDAIVAVAERHGIDVSKFREGIQQINNYGVIASKIDGPVAMGDGAQANQNKAESNRSEHPVSSKIGAGAAA